MPAPLRTFQVSFWDFKCPIILMGEGNGNGLLGYSTVLTITDHSHITERKKKKKNPSIIYLLNNSLSLQENSKETKLE